MSRVTIVALLVLVLGGCDSFPTAAYSLGSSASYSAEGDLVGVCNRLAVVAKAHGLEARIPKRDATQCYFFDDDMDTLVIGARTLRHHLIVDLQAFNRLQEFRKLRDALEAMLEEQYGDTYLRVVE